MQPNRLVLITFSILPLILASNFCGLSSCGNRTHIDCLATSEQISSPSACKNSVLLDLSIDREALVKKHNVLRNQVAGGIFVNQASRMGTMRWNVTLANLGRKNLEKCNFSYDDCVNTPDFAYVGQNIARAVYPKNSATKKALPTMEEFIDQWFQQNEVTQRHNLDFYPGTASNADAHLRNYCQLVHELTTRVGCAAMRYEEGNNYVLLFTCLYDSSNKKNWPVYLVGEAASKCKTGSNPDYPNLCSIKETYKVNQFQQEYAEANAA